MREAAGMDDPGLLNGKMGVALYFFYLARETENPEHQNFAETLLDQVYENIQNNPVPCGFGDGLAGIAWALAHLVKEKFVEADLDEILSDADDKIYHYLSNSQQISFGLPEGLMGYLVYAISRLEGYKDTNTERDFVFKRLLMDLLNRTSTAMDERNWRLAEPPIFTLNWDLPLCLILLGKAKNLGVYGSKINRMIESISPSVLSLLPSQQANKLFLLSGLKCLLSYVDLPLWEKHAALIQHQLDIHAILNKELRDKNIFLSNGLAGLSFILKALSPLPVPQFGSLQMEREITEKITRSNHFNSILKGKSESKPNLGLMQGLAGIGMQFLFSLWSNRALAK